MGEDAAQFLNDPNSSIVLGDDELASAPAPIQPHWDPVLKSSRALRRDLISKLRGAGLITWRKTAIGVRSVLSLFLRKTVASVLCWIVAPRTNFTASLPIPTLRLLGG